MPLAAIVGVAIQNNKKLNPCGFAMMLEGELACVWA